MIMLPVITLATEETLLMIPVSLREAALALGVSYPRTVLKVILPAGASGIITGTLLAVARAAGETAPLLFTSFGSPYMVVQHLQAHGVAAADDFLLRDQPVPRMAVPGLGGLLRAAGHRAGTESRDEAGDIEMEDSVLTAEKTILETRGLTAGFDGKDVVKSISIAVPEQRVTAIMGPSGCGKTTFMRCINRMHELAPNAQVRGRCSWTGRMSTGSTPSCCAAASAWSSSGPIRSRP